MKNEQEIRRFMESLQDRAKGILESARKNIEGIPIHITMDAAMMQANAKVLAWVLDEEVSPKQQSQDKWQH